MSDHYLCIHGHFYQPPRENPWLEYLEVQDSAAPFHDWNERVFYECYAANSAARISDQDGNILAIINNYEYISFNFGPTILEWMEFHSPEVYHRILEADQKSQAHFGGHGNAIAQVYNHLIMPLATRRDKITQIAWGISDFEKRFGRSPEGMWLAETAADTETLEILADQGIQFTILSPYQANAIFKNPAFREDVSSGNIDPTRAYKVSLKTGKSIAIFFYDAHISRAVAFEHLLRNSDDFTKRLLNGLSSHRTHPQLLHIATDGESYGHHSKFGEMALAYTLNTLRHSTTVTLTNYAQFLELHPPEYEVEIKENSSWSCSHGIERWRSDCGCHTSGGPGWNQQWRQPLRKALDFVKAACDDVFERDLTPLVPDPWRMLIDYFDVMWETNPNVIDVFLLLHIAPGELHNKVKILKLLEIQRNSMLMYTSCGWFFSEISGIETIQILKYACRALQLLREFGVDIETEFAHMLAKAPSNVPEYVNGEKIYLTYVKPCEVGLKRVTVHFAINSLFQNYKPKNNIYAFNVDYLDYSKETLGVKTMGMGHVRITSQRTSETQDYIYAVLHYGDVDFHCSLDLFTTTQAYVEKKKKILDAFAAAPLTDLVRLLFTEFNQEYATLDDLFGEEKRHLLYVLAKEEINRIMPLMSHTADKIQKVLDYYCKEQIPIPKLLGSINEYAMIKKIESLFSETVSGLEILESVTHLMDSAKAFAFQLDLKEIEPVISNRLDRLSRTYMAHPRMEESLKEFVLALRATKLLPFNNPLWSLKNLWYDFLVKTESDLEKWVESEIPTLVDEVKHLLKIALTTSLK